MNKRIFALVDCNNFFVSCERAFNARIQNVPVAVLSNNDGCIIARSNEVKALGVKVGAPVYKNEALIKKNNIQLFSSNFALYADMSERVMNTLRRFCPTIEVYSIDEAFLSFSNMYIRDFEAYGREIRAAVLQETGIPVSVGIAPTKVLCKCANEIVKTNLLHCGVLDFTQDSEAQLDRYLDQVEIGDVWGVGRKYAYWLSELGITTAKHLKYANEKMIRKRMTVQGERIVLELRGISCIALEEDIKPKQGIMSSKSFGRPVTALSELQEAIANYSARAVYKLRQQNSLSSVLYVYIRTNHFSTRDFQYSGGISCKLPYPSSYSPDFIKAAMEGLQSIYRRGYKYHKAGVYITKIISDDTVQLDLFGEYPNIAYTRGNKLMKTVDGIHRKWGKDSISFARQGVKKEWGMKQLHRSPRYTTVWNEIPIVQ